MDDPSEPTDDTAPARPSRAERVAAARAVVYDADGELIQPAALDDALEDAGVEVGVDEAGRTQYRNVHRELSLSACHLAVDLHRDPADLIAE